MCFIINLTFQTDVNQVNAKERVENTFYEEEIANDIMEYIIEPEPIMSLEKMNNVAEYSYDKDKQRISKTVGSDVTFYTYSDKKLVSCSTNDIKLEFVYNDIENIDVCTGFIYNDNRYSYRISILIH